MEEKNIAGGKQPADNGGTVKYDEGNIRHLSDMEHVRTRP